MITPSERTRVVLVARQAGSSAAFVSLVEWLAAAGKRPPLVFAYPPARSLLRQECIEFTSIDDFSDALSKLDSVEGDTLMITGTSLAVADDARWWRWATTRNIPTVAFIDQWGNYWQRFSSSDKVSARFDSLPDVIAVIDRRAQRCLEDAGCPLTRIVVTGTPALDRWHRGAPDIREAIRLRYLADPSCEELWLLVCEPADPVHDPRNAAFMSALSWLEKALSNYRGPGGRRAKLLLRPHPVQEAEGNFPPITAGLRNQTERSSAEIPATALVAAADLVLGFRSILLYEAAAAGNAVVALSPLSPAAGEVVDPLPGVATVHRAAELLPTIATVRAFKRAPRRPEAFAASRRFFAAIETAMR